MVDLARLHRLHWAPRLAIALAAGFLTDQLLAQVFTGLFHSMGIWVQDALLGPYAVLMLFFRATCAAFVAGLIFGRFELLVAVLNYLLLGMFGLFILRLLAQYDAMRPDFRTEYDTALGFYSSRIEIALDFVIQGIFMCALGAYLAWIIRKYREARVYGQRTKALPSRWNFRLGGGLIFLIGTGFSAFAVYRLIAGAFGDTHFNPITAGIAGALMCMAAIFFAHVSAFGRRLMSVRDRVPSGDFDFLLIRSFEDDSIPCVPSYPFWLLNTFVHPLDGRKLTDAIVHALGRFGRVLAVGDPREVAGGGGEVRPYFPAGTEEWKAHVREALGSARMIVVLLGTSEGLAWEIGEIRRLGLLGRTVFVLPAEEERKAAKRTRSARLEALRNAAGLEVQEAEIGGDGLAAIIAEGRGHRVIAAQVGDFSRLRDTRAFLAQTFEERLAEIDARPSTIRAGAEATPA